MQRRIASPAIAMGSAAIRIAVDSESLVDWIRLHRRLH
jgi:hypothetical protein